MGIQAQWGNKAFVISPSKIVPLLKLSTGFAKKETDSEDTSGQPTTNTRGIDLQSITLETRYLAGTGSDPRGQIEDWKAQFGKRYPLYIAGRRFGPKLMELENVQFSNIVVDNSGRFIQVDASISLKEYVPPTITLAEKKGQEAGDAGTTDGAMGATPSETDRERLKITTH